MSEATTQRAKPVLRRNLWLNLTTDIRTGRYSGKAVGRTLCLILAILYFFHGCNLEYHEKRPDWSILIALLVAAGILQGVKEWGKYLDRHEYDSNGNSLTLPPATTPPAGEPAPDAAGADENNRTDD